MTKAGIWSWFGILALALAVIGLRLSTGLPLESDMLALLPQKTTEAPWAADARNRIATDVSQRVVFVVSHSEQSNAGNAATSLRNTLIDHNLIQNPTVAQTTSDTQNIGTALFPFRLGLLSAQDRAFMAQNNPEGIRQSALAQLYSPFGFVDQDVLRNDPYLLFPRFMTGLNSHSFEIDPARKLPFISGKDRFHFIIDAKINGAVASPDFQNRFIPTVTDLLEGLQGETPALEIQKAGSIFYASSATQSAKGEVSSVGLISIAGILALVFIVFRNFKPLLFSLVAMASGAAVGLAVNLAIFEKIHLMSLVFGVGFLGVSVDYAFHYCCGRFSTDAQSPKQRIASIFNGLTMGFISSLIGFACFALTPFPGLQQIALFFMSGLAMSYLTVVFIFPLLDGTSEQKTPDWIIGLTRKTQEIILWGGSHRGPQRILLVLITLVIGFGLFRFQSDDDIRRLQDLPVELQTEHQAIQDIIGNDQAGQYFLIESTDQELALQAEERLVSGLDRLIADQALTGYSALSSLVPSIARQTQNRTWIAATLLDGQLADYLTGIGYEAEAGYDSHASGFLVPSDLSEFDAATRLMLTNEDGQSVQMVLLNGVQDLDALIALAERDDNVKFIDTTAEISATLAQYRLQSLYLLALASAVITIFLTLRYGVSRGLRIAAIPISAVILTPLILAILGSTFTFFNAIALILVLALGLDYVLFFAESTADHLHISFLANTLSALSTLLAFGLLTFSQQYAVHAFGVTILTGVTLAFLLAPLGRQITENKVKL